MHTGHITLALDEMMRTLTPDQATTLRNAVPIGYRDQLDAAHAQTMNGINAADGLGLIEDRADLPAHEHPDWVRLGVLDTHTRWWLGHADTCTHNPNPARPQPVFAAAWRPGLVVCTACPHLLGLASGSTADRTCDACGNVTTGPDNGDPIYCINVVCGLLTYQAGTCSSCRYWPTHTNAPQAKETRQ